MSINEVLRLHICEEGSYNLIALLSWHRLERQDMVSLDKQVIHFLSFSFTAPQTVHGGVNTCTRRGERERGFHTICSRRHTLKSQVARVDNDHPPTSWVMGTSHYLKALILK